VCFEPCGVNSQWGYKMANLEIFRALCLKVADEQDPKKLELLKQRMRILLQENPDVTNAADTTVGSLPN
jgi:hypothetical protein